MGLPNSYAYFMPFAPLADSVHKDRLQHAHATISQGARKGA